MQRTTTNGISSQLENNKITLLGLKAAHPLQIVQSSATETPPPPNLVTANDDNNIEKLQSKPTQENNKVKDDLKFTHDHQHTCNDRRNFGHYRHNLSGVRTEPQITQPQNTLQRQHNILFASLTTAKLVPNDPSPRGTLLTHHAGQP